MQLTDNTILITGGTSGIGRALAEALHRLGNHVVIAGRRQALLDEVTAANPGMRGMQVDLASAEGTMAFAAQVRAEVPALNVLVNNAGISRPEDLTSATLDRGTARAIIDTNILAVLDLTTALLPVLTQQPRASIVTMTSGLAFMPLAGFPAYCASKAFLHSWLQSLRVQLRATAVEVIEVAPPYVQTELTGAAQAADPHAVPLAKFVADLVALLGAPLPANGELLDEKAMGLRTAERDGTYDQIFAQMNAPRGS